jgi:hypothetical protein
MYQNIIISPSMIDFIESNINSGSDLLNKFKVALEEDFIIVDKGEKLYSKMEDKVCDQDKDEEMEWFFAKWEKFNTKSFEVEKKLHIKGVTEEDQIEATLAKLNEDSIWLKSEESIQEKQNALKKILSGGTNPISFKKYALAEDTKDKLVRLCFLHKKAGPRPEAFPFPLFYKPLFKKAKKIEIQDWYIVKPSNYRTHDPLLVEKHIDKIIKYCSSDCNIEITTSKLHTYSYKNKFYEYGEEDKIENWKRELEENYNNVKVTLSSSKGVLGGGRHIFFHMEDKKIQLILDHGLQVFGDDGKMIETSSFGINKV